MNIYSNTHVIAWNAFASGSVHKKKEKKEERKKKKKKLEQMKSRLLFQCQLERPKQEE